MNQGPNQNRNGNGHPEPPLTQGNTDSASAPYTTQDLGGQAPKPPEAPQSAGEAQHAGATSAPYAGQHAGSTQRLDSGYSAQTQSASTQQIPQGTVPSQKSRFKKHASVVAATSSGNRVFLKAFLGALLACVLALGVYTIFFGGSGRSTIIGSSGSTDITASDDSTTLAEQVAEKDLPSVASIYVYSNSANMYGGQSGSSSVSSLGSGVVLSADGYIITNYHVIADADSLKVTVGGKEYDADVVGYDASSDIAVVKAKNASDLTPIEIGDSDSIKTGEWVMTLGSPYGLEQSVATGIVSATNRSQVISGSSENGGSSSNQPTIYTNMIQTDAAINPGNSGGALVDADGKLIGINTLIASYSGSYSGVGFAIPSNYAINLAQQIIDGKTPTHAKLGVTMATVTSENAQMYGLATDSGVYVNSVESGSGAEQAGIKSGDIITSFDGKEVKSTSELMLAIREKNAGDTVKIQVNRDGQTQEFDVKLGSDEGSQSKSQQESGSSTLNDLLGQ
ncbi:MAG: S1C family serine protease [Eggerthellaceae bacterium]